MKHVFISYQHEDGDFADVLIQKVKDAGAASEQVIRLDSGFAPAYFNKSVALVNLSRNEEALVACEQGLSYDPKDTDVYNLKQHLLSVLGKKQ